MAWAGVQRLVPVGAAGYAAYLIGMWTHTPPVYSYGLFYGVQLQELIAMVSLPVLAWTLWAPTAKLAFRVGLLLLAGVAGWGWWLSRVAAGVSPVNRTGLYRAFPLAAGAAVVLAVTLVYLSRWWRRPAASSRASSYTFWDWLGTALRVTTGCVVLAVAVALHFIWMEPSPPVADAVLLAG